MKNRKKSHKVTSALLFALSAILVAASIAGYAARTNGGTRENLNEMRTYAVMHAATSGVVESLVTDAGAAKLKELRARKDFRQLGGDEVNRIYEEAKAQTRAESEGKYAAALDIVDTAGLIAPINAFCAAQNVYAEARETERAAYAALYAELVKAVGDWAELTEGLDDDQLLAALQAKIPALTKPENAHLGAGFVRMARAMADAANMKKRTELQTQLTSAMISSVSNWEELYDAAEDDEALWAALTARLSELKENETFKAELLTEARACIQQAKDGVEIVAPSLSETDEPAEDAEIVVDEQYFSVSEATAALEAPADEAYDALWGALVERIPDLDSLSAKYKELIRASIVEIAESENAGFMTRYRIYEKQSAASLLSSAAALMMKAAAYAEQVLIAGIAVLILALAVTFWGTLIRRLGVPRTIISFAVHHRAERRVEPVRRFRRGRILPRVSVLWRNRAGAGHLRVAQRPAEKERQRAVHQGRPSTQGRQGALTNKKTLSFRRGGAAFFHIWRVQNIQPSQRRRHASGKPCRATEPAAATGMRAMVRPFSRISTEPISSPAATGAATLGGRLGFSSISAASALFIKSVRSPSSASGTLSRLPPVTGISPRTRVPLSAAVSRR